MKDQNKKPSAGAVNKRIFYVALGICLLAIIVALYVGVTSTMQELGVDNPVKNQATSSIPASSALGSDAQVNATQSGVAVVGSAASGKTSVTASAPGGKASSTPAKAPAPTGGKFIRPVEGEVINPFSNGELVKSKTLMEWRTHDGVDFKSEPNTPVKAVAAGKVKDISEDSMWGVCVVIEHQNNIESMYFGLKPNVPLKKGADVKSGEIVGYVGNTAEIELALDSHLHFAMKQEGQWIDPMKLLP